MVQALELAADDAGSRGLLARADSVRGPRGFWNYRDPCRLVADALGVMDARTEVAQIGVLQTTLLGDGKSTRLNSSHPDIPRMPSFP